MNLYGKRYTILYRFILFYMFKWRDLVINSKSLTKLFLLFPINLEFLENILIHNKTIEKVVSVHTLKHWDVKIIDNIFRSNISVVKFACPIYGINEHNNVMCKIDYYVDRNKVIQRYIKIRDKIMKKNYRRLRLPKCLIKKIFSELINIYLCESY